MFAVALALRMAAVVALDTPGEAAGRTPWQWGHESACVAHALAFDGFLGDPWGQGTGPSGWLTPVYPAILAAILRVCGGVGAPAAWVLFSLHALVSAATCVLVVRLGRALGAARAGVLAGWALALWPVAIWNSAQTVWDTTFVAAALTGYLLLLVGTPRAAGLWRRAGLGALFGALLLLNPAPAALLPVVLVVAARVRGRARALGAALVFLAAAALVVVPWCLRNARVLGTPALRSNLGVELRVGNNPDADGRHQTAYHPSHTDLELERYRALGERAYAAWSGERAREWIAAEPARFLALSLRRAQIFWIGEPPTVDPRREAGRPAAEDPKAWVKWALHLSSGVAALLMALGFRYRELHGWLLRGVVVLFPLPYYVTHVAERYRFPLEPIVLLLACQGIVVFRDRVLRRRAPLAPTAARAELAERT